MKVTPISNNLFQLTHLRAVNCFLVREDDGFTLIDTSWPSSQAQAIMEVAQQLNLPIARILLTHAHIDHVGSLDALHEALPNVPVGISERDARLLAGDLSVDPSEPQDKVGGYACKTKPTMFLHDGERVGSLEVIATPGHSPGHVAFLDTRDQSLIAGDAFQTLGGVAVSGTFVWRFPLVAMSSWNSPLCLESAHKLLALQPSHLGVGHGHALANPAAEMQRAIQVMERDLAKEAKGKSHAA
jgi:glyoxylase-like metal-dependent hydrolase (beta-lactamase superfamily II)